jgi:hypothetical protein
MDILRNSYLDNAIFKTDETLYMRWFNRVLHVYKVSDQNSKIWIFSKTRVVKKEFSKKSLSRPNLGKNRNPLGVCYSSESLHMGTVWRVMERITGEPSLESD